MPIVRKTFDSMQVGDYITLTTDSVPTRDSMTLRGRLEYVGDRTSALEAKIYGLTVRLTDESDTNVQQWHVTVIDAAGDVTWEMYFTPPYDLYDRWLTIVRYVTELTRPPGLGAVVQSKDGTRYVRTGESTWRAEDKDDVFEWGEFEAYEVLAEGVTPPW